MDLVSLSNDYCIASLPANVGQTGLNDTLVLSAKQRDRIVVDRMMLHNTRRACIDHRTAVCKAVGAEIDSRVHATFLRGMKA